MTELRHVLSGLLVWGLAGISGHVIRAQEAPPERGDPRWLLPIPESQLDSEIPTLKDVVGHGWAERISSPEQITRYLEALAGAAPDRAKLVRYGTTYEGRPLSYLVVTAGENLERIEEIRRAILDLADPRVTSAARADRLAGEIPAVVWLAYGVHGNESSSSDAALITAYSLLADRRPETREVLRKLVVIFDPLQNPDGRERFLSAFREALGVFPDPERLGREHTERWPGGRSNHYYFDMNRDWFLQTQDESKAKVAAYLDWQPQIYVDAHEMGSGSTYYFDPPSDPINSRITSGQKDWYMRIGRHHGDWFDRYGFAYTTRELFDAFYPGYGSTWPTMHGAIGILWEQAGVRGLVVEREDETRLHYHDAVRHHYISGLATIEVAAAEKDRLLKDFHRTRATAIEEGKALDAPDFLLLPGATPSRAARLARLLIANGIEVRAVPSGRNVVARGPVDDVSREYTIPAGSYHVTAGQPAGRLVRTLLERSDTMGESFIQRQIDRRARRLSDEIYDVTAWSLPLTFGVTCLETKLDPPLDSPPLKDAQPIGLVEGPEAPRVGYIVEARDEAAIQALAGWLRAGYRVHMLDQPTKIQGRDFVRGTLLLRTTENPETLHQAVLEAAQTYGLRVLGLDSSFVDEGAALGGPNVTWVKPPRILMPVGDGVGSSVGHTWYLFDRVWGYPVTRVEARSLVRSVDLAKYNVIVLPEGSYSGSDGFDEAAVTKIKEWVRDGGTLVLLGSATAWAVGEKVGLLASEPKKARVEPIPGEGLERPDDDTTSPEAAKDETPAAGEETPEDQVPAAAEAKREKRADDADETAEKPVREAPDPISGAFLRATVYEDHWITAGMPAEIDILLGTGLVLKPLKPTDGRNLVTFQDRETPVSGFGWPRTMKLLVRTPYLLYQSAGRGHVVGFTDDPNFRAFSPVTSRLFQNAVFFGPGH